MDQLSFFTSGFIPPLPADWAGLLAAQGQTQMEYEIGKQNSGQSDHGGTPVSARISVVVSSKWRADGLMSLAQEAGLLCVVELLDEFSFADAELFSDLPSAHLAVVEPRGADDKLANSDADTPLSSALTANGQAGNVGVDAAQNKRQDFGKTAASNDTAAPRKTAPPNQNAAHNENQARDESEDLGEATHERYLVRVTDRRLIAVVNQWTKGAVKHVPSSWTPSAPALRAWVLAAGHSDRWGYVLGLDSRLETHAPQREALQSGLRQAGINSVYLGARGGGPALRVTGRKRLSLLRELVGEPPSSAGSDWPRDPTTTFP